MKDMNENQTFNPLALDNQICFALYVCSKEIIRKYTPLLEPLGLTYTSYITLLSLWEKDNVTVKELGSRLFLDSGTLTPLLKKIMENSLLDAKDNNNGEVTPEHLFSALLEEGEGIAIRILIGMGISLEDLYDEFSVKLIRKQKKRKKLRT